MIHPFQQLMDTPLPVAGKYCGIDVGVDYDDWYETYAAKAEAERPADLDQPVPYQPPVKRWHPTAPTKQLKTLMAPDRQLPILPDGSPLTTESLIDYINSLDTPYLKIEDHRGLDDSDERSTQGVSIWKSGRYDGYDPWYWVNYETGEITRGPLAAAMWQEWDKELALKEHKEPDPTHYAAIAEWAEKVCGDLVEPTVSVEAQKLF